jgi:hypothetical protein
MPVFRLLYDTAVVLDPTAERPSAFPPLSAPDEMSAMWRQVGLTEVEQTSLTIRMDFLDFDDYWRPLEGGVGPPGLFLATLSGARAQRCVSMCGVAFCATAPTARARSRPRPGRVVEPCRPRA